MFLKILLLIIYSFNFSANAEDATSSSLISEFKDGIIFKYEPASFLMKTSFRMQNRFTAEDYDSNHPKKSDLTEFMTRRLRLKLDGHVIDPKLIYTIQLSFTRGDQDWDNLNYPNILRDAVLGYKFSTKDILYFGLRKLPGNRQRVISSGAQEFVDRSLANATFNIDRDIGLQSWHQFFENNPLWLKLALTNGGGRGQTNPDNGLAYTARVEWLPFGDFKNGGDYFESDLEFEEDLKASLGAVYSMNKSAVRTGGQILETLTSPRDIENIIADILLKYNGWAFSAEWFKRNSPDANVTATQTIYSGKGLNTQLSYTTSNYYTPALRWTKITPDTAYEGALQDKEQLTLGLSKYINRHKVKVQGDITWEQENRFNGSNKLNNYFYRLQVELGI